MIRLDELTELGDEELRPSNKPYVGLQTPDADGGVDPELTRIGSAPRASSPPGAQTRSNSLGGLLPGVLGQDPLARGATEPLRALGIRE